METTLLFQDEVLPLCSESYLSRNPLARKLKMEAVPDEDLIHTNWGPSFMSHPTWQDWFSKTGAVRPASAKGYQVGMSNLALNLARDGLGVALGQRSMAEDDLTNGRLVLLSKIPVALGHPYCLVHSRNKGQRTAISKLIAWLVESPQPVGMPDDRL
jgi:LysR family glycine cleavage system transcriptional activator